MRSGGGRKPRLTEVERSTILALVKRLPPGKPGDERTGAFEAEDARADAPAEWTLDTLTAAARDHGIQVARSQVRCIFLREGVRWRRTHPWATSNDADFVPLESNRRALHRPTRGRDGPLPRCIGASDAAGVPFRSWLVTRWPPQQSPSGVWARQ